MAGTNTIEISVNGERFQVPDGNNIIELLQFLKLTPDRVAVELNKVLVRKRDWEATGVSGGAQLEVVEFVGGG